MGAHLEAVERAIVLLGRPGGWTQRVNARDLDGKVTAWGKFEARKFDVEGALRRCAGELQQRIWLDLNWNRVLIPETGKYEKQAGPLIMAMYPHTNLFDWNDETGRTQQDAITLLRDVAEILKQREENGDDFTDADL